jgi:hypothetical protein
MEAVIVNGDRIFCRWRNKYTTGIMTTPINGKLYSEASPITNLLA